MPEKRAYPIVRPLLDIPGSAEIPCKAPIIMERLESSPELSLPNFERNTNMPVITSAIPIKRLPDSIVKANASTRYPTIAVGTVPATKKSTCLP